MNVQTTNLSGKQGRRASRFLTRALLLFVGWQALYHLVLQPWGQPDALLTRTVLAGTLRLLQLFFADVTLQGNSILINHLPSVSVADACNGLELIALYLGFILLLPSDGKRMAGFAALGISVIILLNIIRCSALAVLYQHDISTAHFAHKYLFTLIVYAFVFYGWMRYTKKPVHEQQL